MVDFVKAEFDDKLGQWVAATGRPGARVAEFDGEKWAETGRNPEPGALSRGITTGVETTKGLLSEALPALVQSAFGYDEAAQKNLLEYQERLKKLQESGLGSRVGLEDIKDVGSFFSFLGESVGEGAVSLLTAAIPGVGLGAAGASTVGRAAVSRAAGKVASTAAETAAKEIAKREAAGIAVDAGTRAAIEKAALEAAPALIGRNWGQMAGLALGSAAQNMPETFAKIYTETGEMRPEVATLVGGLKSSLDILGPLQLIKKTRGIDFSEKLSDVLAGRLLKGMPGTAGAIGGLLESAALEGLTEGTQELIDQLAVATLADKSINWKDIAQASLKGAFGTAVPGAAAGFVGQRAKAREAAQLGEMRGEQQAEEQRQVELQERYALLGEEPPAGPNFQRDAVSLLRRSKPNVPFTDEGRVDLEAAEKYAEENLPPSQRKAYLKQMRKLDLEAQDQVFLYVKDQEAKKVAAEQETTRRGEARRADEAQRASDADIIQQGNADTSLLRDPAFRQQFDEARQRETQRRTQERTERLADEEMLAGLGFGDFPPRATPLQTERAQVPEDVRDALLDAGYRLDQIAQMGPDVARNIVLNLRREEGAQVAERAPKLQSWVRKEVEDYLGELKAGQRVSLPVMQQRLKDAGLDASKRDVIDILAQYAPGAESYVPVDAQFRLGRVQGEDGVFVKQVGTPSVTPVRQQIGEPTGVPTKGGFEGVTLGTEVSRPVTPLQGTLQNPPAGLTPQQYEAMRNRVIRMDPKKILTKKDLDAAGGPGVELTQQQAKDIWEALSSNGDVKRAGLGFRVNPEAELSTQFRDEGSPRTDRPTEVTGQELLDKGTRNKLYGLGYTREDIGGMSPEEARDVADRREKKPPATPASARNEPSGTQASLKPAEAGIPQAMSSSLRSKPTLESVGWYQDNPGLRGNQRWVTDKQAQAEASDPQRALVGSITAKFQKSVPIPTEMLASIPGARGEQRRKGESQYDALVRKVTKKGWDPSNPITIDVNHRGEPYIYEGNTRVAVARDKGIPEVLADIRWLNGGEMAEGDWTPAKVLEKIGSKPTETGQKAAISAMFPDLDKMNVPKGSKEVADAATKLEAEINRQVEMGEPATKPYDCR